MAHQGPLRSIVLDLLLTCTEILDIILNVARLISLDNLNLSIGIS